MPLDGAALSSDDKGSEVWLRDGVLTRTSSFWSKMSYAELLLNACNPSFGEVLWEGDALAPRDLPAAARPADMHGFVKKVVGKVKSRVELAPSLALAMGEGGQLFGWCSFENPRRMCKGAPVVSDAQTCYCVFHRHCIDEWKGTGSSNCWILQARRLFLTSTSACRQSCSGVACTGYSHRPDFLPRHPSRRCRPRSSKRRRRPRRRRRRSGHRRRGAAACGWTSMCPRAPTSATA